MKITDRLKVEHGVFLEQLGFLELLIAQKAPHDVVGAALEVVMRAEEIHDDLEDRVFYPALARVVTNPAPLAEVDAQHADIRSRIAQIREQPFGNEQVLELIVALRAHMEREIHLVFPLAEELLSADTLESLASWDEEHVYRAAGRRDEWKRRLSARSDK